MKTTSDPSGSVISIGLSPQAEKEIDSTLNNLADGLACGFGGGGCLATPINWAPLAPGNAISSLGEPQPKKPNVNQGLPIFAALTKLGT